MANLNYLDFGLRIEQHGSGYRPSTFRSHRSANMLTSTLNCQQESQQKYYLPPTRAKDRHLVDPTASMQRASPKEFGRLLFETVFRDAVLMCLRSSLTVAETRNEGRLRIRLDLTDAPGLIDLPWEYLFDPEANRFLCLSLDTPLVRYLDVPGQIQPLAVKPPLRALVVMASPEDLPPLNVNVEWQRMQKARSKTWKRPICWLWSAWRHQRLRRCKIDCARKPIRYCTLLAIAVLTMRLARMLIFGDENNHSRFVTGELFSTILHDAKALRLVILNTCSGAKTSIADPFAGISQLLIQQGIPSLSQCSSMSPIRPRSRLRIRSTRRWSVVIR